MPRVHACALVVVVVCGTTCLTHAMAHPSTFSADAHGMRHIAHPKFVESIPVTAAAASYCTNMSSSIEQNFSV
jgi:hypothetical protein